MVKVMKEHANIPDAIVNNFMRIKTKTEAIRVFVYWVRASEGSALPYPFLSTLGQWASERARLNIHNIQKTVFIANGKNGRHAGVTADFNAHGVFSFCQFNQTTNKFMAVAHNFSGVQAVFQELTVAEDWVLEFNHCEFLAQAKGKGSYDLLTEFANPDYKEGSDVPEYLIVLPFNQAVIPSSVAREQQTPTALVPFAGSSTGRSGKRKLGRNGSAASSAPEGDGNA